VCRVIQTPTCLYPSGKVLRFKLQWDFPSRASPLPFRLLSDCHQHKYQHGAAKSRKSYNSVSPLYLPPLRPLALNFSANAAKQASHCKVRYAEWHVDSFVGCHPQYVIGILCELIGEASDRGRYNRSRCISLAVSATMHYRYGWAWRM
jgi:hypothetical protein